jgi:hypothetical protein
MIGQLIACDLYRIEAADPYSDDYDATVDRNVREQNDNARPGIANLRTSISDYDTVLVGSPIWNNRAPMIMSTFVESLERSGCAGSAYGPEPAQLSGAASLGVYWQCLFHRPAEL